MSMPAFGVGAGNVVSIVDETAELAGAAQIVVTEERVEPYDLGVYTCVGMAPAKYQFLLLKSRMYCRPVFGPISKGLVECDSDSGGPTSSNYALFPFAKIRRPIYPLDGETVWGG